MFPSFLVVSLARFNFKCVSASSDSFLVIFIFNKFYGILHRLATSSFMLLVRKLQRDSFFAILLIYFLIISKPPSATMMELLLATMVELVFWPMFKLIP
jgi:hypothetical protein